MNDAREFSIPSRSGGCTGLRGRRGRPSRRTRNGEATPIGSANPMSSLQVVDEPARIVEPPPIVDEPRVTTEADEIVEIPDVPEPSDDPVEEGLRTRGERLRGAQGTARGVDGASSGARRRPDRASRTADGPEADRCRSVSGPGPATEIDRAMAGVSSSVGSSSCGQIDGEFGWIAERLLDLGEELRRRHAVERAERVKALKRDGALCPLVAGDGSGFEGAQGAFADLPQREPTGKSGTAERAPHLFPHGRPSHQRSVSVGAAGGTATPSTRP